MIHPKPTTKAGTLAFFLTALFLTRNSATAFTARALEGSKRTTAKHERTITMKQKSKNICLTMGLAVLLLLPRLGQCFYNPSTGSWLSRDPIGEQGGNNL